MKKTFSEPQASSLSARRFLLGASLLSLCVLPACSDSDDDGGALPGAEKNAPTLQVVPLEVTSGQADRVTTYQAVSGTRAVAEGEEDEATTTIAAGEALPAAIAANEVVVVEGQPAKSNTTLVVNGTVTFNADVIDLSGVAITVNAGGTLVANRLIAPSLTVAGGAAQIGESSLIAQTIAVSAGKLSITGDAKVVGNVELSGNGVIAVAAGKTLTVGKELNIASTTAKFYSETAQYSYIQAQILNAGNVDLTTNFGNGYYAVLADNIKLNGAAAVASTFEQPSTLYLTSDEAKFQAWTAQSGSEVTILAQTKRVSAPTSTNTLSATGIAVNGSDIYVSYHTRGNNFDGAIDVYQDGAVKTLAATRQKEGSEATGVDFNHIIYANGKIYAVGSSSYSAVIGYVDAANPTSITYRSLYSEKGQENDGNSVILNGDYLQVASVYGYEVYEAAGLRRAVATPMTHSKSIVKSSTGDVAVLSYVGEPAETASESKTYSGLQEIGFKVNTFDAYDYELQTATALSGFSGSILAPTFGKNTVAESNGVYYVAAGAYGVLTSDGKNFTLDAIGENKDLAPGYANCVTTDGTYIYAAYGSAGVYVLDKNLNEVASYVNAGGKSANYVLAANGNIYVAYGEDGWQVLELRNVVK